jgi:tetratricopeptide (TPR) repeat protein
MEKEEALLHDQPDLEMNLDTRHGDVAAAHGQIQKARDFYEKGRQVAQRLQLKDSEAFYLGAQAYALAMFGQSKKATETANAALALAPSYNVKFYTAGVLALGGENRKALDAAAQATHDRPDDTFVREVQAPVVQAAIALNTGDPRKAIARPSPPKGRTRRGCSRGIPEDSSAFQFRSHRSVDALCAPRLGPHLCSAR